ncbi:MAG: DUF1573 domain-containing protein [Bacteroidota bacterium]
MSRFLVIVFILLTAPVFTQRAVFYAPKKTIRFPKTTEGAKLKYRYIIKNTGKAPLEFYGFDTECTCTEVTLPQNPLKPNEQNFIDIVFDTNGKYFFQDRVIYLSTNTRKKREKLRFKVFVVPKD